MSNEGATVAMIMASTGIIPPRAWSHNADLRDRNRYTVAMILANHKICDIPLRWRHKPDI